MASNPQADLFGKLGIKYEEAFGHDEGLLRFIDSSLDRLAAGTSILEVGSGTGRPLAARAAERGFRVHGIDVSGGMVALARRQVAAATFEEADMRGYSPGTRYDAVFSVFSVFHMSRDEMAALTRRWASWVQPRGFLFVGTMAADDFPHATPDLFDADGLCARGVMHTFMGRRVPNLLYSRKGWEALLVDAGFEVVETSMTPFQAPPEAECDLEPHYYIVAQKIDWGT